MTPIELGLLPEGTEVTHEDGNSITYRVGQTDRYYWDKYRKMFYHVHQHCNKGHSRAAAARTSGVTWANGYRGRGLGYIYIFYTDREQLRAYYRAYEQVCVEARHSEPAPKPVSAPRVKKAPKPVKQYRCFIEGMDQFEEQTIEATSHQKAKEQYEEILTAADEHAYYKAGAYFSMKAKEIK